MSDKFAIAILSDPSSGSEEALGRALNGLLVAKDLNDKGAEVCIFFQGTGTRWPKALLDTSHPGNQLYESVKDSVIGASEACSAVFKADTGDLKLLSECEIPGLGAKATSLAKYLLEGYTLLTF